MTPKPSSTPLTEQECAAMDVETLQPLPANQMTDQQFISTIDDMVNRAEKPSDWDEDNDTAQLYPSTENAFLRNAFIPEFKGRAIALVEHLTGNPLRYEMLINFLDSISGQNLPRTVNALTRYRSLLGDDAPGRRINDILALDDFFMRSQVVPVDAEGKATNFEVHLNSVQKYPEIKDAHPRIPRYAENRAFINAVEQNPQNLDGVMAYFRHYGISEDFQQSDFLDYLSHGSLADGHL